MPSRCCSPSDSIRFQCASSSSRCASAGRPTARDRLARSRSASKRPARPDRRSRPRSEPTGKYGRCGSIISVRPSARRRVPVPNGQMPAIARNSVDLPEPDGPVTSVRSPRANAKPSAATSGAPFGRRTARSSRPMRVAGRRPATCDRWRRCRRRPARCRSHASKPSSRVDHRAPFRQRAIGRDEERQRVLHAAEGGRGLHHAAELHLAGEIGRRDQDVGKQHRGLRIARGEGRQLLGAAHDAEPVLDHAAEALEQPRALRGLAAAAARSARSSRARARG